MRHQLNSDREPRARHTAAIAATIALVGAMVVPISQGAVSAAGECGASSNPIVCENSKPGTDPSTWDIDGAGDGSIQGFSTDISVNLGSTIDFKIDTPAPTYTIDIYRTGWYQGLGARKIASVTPLHTPQAAQPACIRDDTVELVDCGTWHVSASWNVPTDAVSGVYLAVLTRPDTGGKSQITFIVRDQSSHSAVVFQTSDPTWQAYNTYGGSDFYQGAANGRAYKVSYNRPIATRGENEGRDFFFSNEYPMIRFLEKNGYDVSYLSGVDTDRYGSLLLNHRVFLSVGHDEYWSAGQRANVEAARDANVNLQFLSGNEAYWRTRYEPSVDPSATPYRTLVSYKETWASAKLDTTSPQWTGTWRDPRFSSPANGGGKPENSLTGTGYMSNNDDLAITVTAAQGKMRMWRNTGLSAMVGSTQALAPHTIGYESDEDLDNGFRPSGMVKLSATTGGTPQYLQDYGRVVLPGTTTHNVTLYRAASGALVFSAGTIQWAWGLDQNHDGNGAAADLRMQQAQVNLLADMDAQPLTLASPLVAAAKSGDTTGPAVTVTSPAAGATIANGTTVTVTGTASDAGGVVAGVNVSTDGGATWRAATGTSSWSYSYVQHGRGDTQVLVRAIDDSGNYTATPKSVTYSVGGPFSMFGAETPVTIDAGDAVARQLGLKFTPTVSGYVSGVRFYKSAANTGQHTGSLWSSDGVRLATVTFANETASGWQQATFTSAVPVQSGTQYLVSYYAPVGHYSAASYYWISRGSTAPPLTAVGGFGAASAGVFSNGDSMPTMEYQTNYYVDAVFDIQDNTPLTVTNPWPLGGSTSVPTTSTISGTMSKPVTESTVSFSVTGAGGATVAGATQYDSTTKTAKFTPASALAPSTVYTVTLSATATTGGTVTGGGTWSFTTAAAPPVAGQCPCSLYADSVQPDVVQVTDTSAVTLGVRFTPSAAGTITALKFYKGVGNTGTHVGTLWSSTGSVLATATFSSESTAGWQTAQLSTPVAVTAGATYIASYRAPVGKYSATSGEFATSYTRGPLGVPYSAGTYNYGTTVPTATTTTSYLVDVVFARSADPITIVSKTPGADATLVSRASSIVVQLSGAVSPGYSLTATSQGSTIAGTTILSSDGKTITFTPASVLPNGATVQASLAGVVSTQGATLATTAWSFTTVNETTTTVTTYTLFGTETPTVTAAAGESSAVELGVSFAPSTAGFVTGIRFYKGAGNDGAHVGHLWSSTGALLATAYFTGETASGWQTAQLSNAVALTAGQTYVVSYFAPLGHYPYTGGYFSAPKTSGPLTAGAAGNGRYLYAAGGGFPQNSYGGSNYFVDLVYSVTTTAGGPTPTPTPTPPPVGTGLFGADTPTTPAADDTSAIEVGVSFTASVAGTVTGISFYKGAGNDGAHVGHLWSSAGGSPLATVNFAAETTTGWQTAGLAAPVTLVVGQTYVVSYFAPHGHYSYTPNYFATAKTTGPLTAAASVNGRYLYTSTGGFPTSTYGNANYFVDVTFSPTP